MAWGGARPGAGRKPNPKKPKTVARTKVPPRQALIEPQTAEQIRAEVKAASVDPRAWMEFLPAIEEISRRYSKKQERTRENNPFRLPVFPKPLLESLQEKNLPTMAMDSALSANLAFSGDQWLSGGSFVGLPGDGLLFLGYTYLSELAQRPEYRVMSETIADDATRKWIDFDVVGDENQQREERAKDPQGYDERMADPDERAKRVKGAGKLDKVKALKDDQLRLEVKDRFYEMFRGDGFFGRMHLFLDIRPPDQLEINQEELKAPLGDSRDEMSRTKVQKGFFQGLRSVEPVWTYPLMYNAINPLRKDWYNPQTWYVMGQELHGTRLQTFVGHPVPDMLKPAYAFGGLSLTQMAKPYVDIWLQTRASIAQLIHSFSVMVLKTDLGTQLQPGNAGALLARVAAFNMLRDNQNTFVVNKNTEEFANVSAPLSGLHELQAQSQEHMACLVAGTLVETTRGPVKIEDVTLADHVLTRSGFHPIKWVGITGHTDTFIRIEAGSSGVTCTEGHPIWSQSSREFVDADSVSRSHRLLALETRSLDDTGLRSLGDVDGGGERKPDITGTKRLAAFFTASCGKLIAARFRTGVRSTTSMRTAPTTIGAILSCSRVPDILRGTLASIHRGIGRTAVFVATSFSAQSLAPSFAVLPASRGHARLATDGSQPATRSSARNAGIDSQSDGRMLGSAPRRACSVPVSSVCEIKLPLQPVYNIEVDGPHEFFANGILVHNSVHRIPLVKFTGIQPAGLNASSEGEIETYDDTIGALQSRFADPNLRRIINFQQLSLWGEIDPEITHRWVELRSLTPAEKGQRDKDDADRNQKYVDMGAISPGEVRKIIVEDPNLPFTGLDPDDVPEPPAEEGLLGPGAGGAAREFEAAEITQDAEPRTLYMHRPLRNVEALRKWALEQGFKSIVSDPHVTVAFSKAPLDWTGLQKRDGGGDITNEAGAPGRSVEPLGDEGAVVLKFDSPALQERWQELKDAGASWDFESYQPHVTITYDGAGVDLDRVRPYDGDLVFGPEVFDQGKTNWRSSIAEDDFSDLDGPLPEVP